MTNPPTSKRTGARRRSDIPTAILAQLNQGEIETANLVEGLAVRFDLLLKSICPDAPQALLRQVADDSLGITRRMQVVGTWLATSQPANSFDELRQHRSDTVRGWAAYQLAELEPTSISRLLKRIEPLADDPHFGVREWAWIAIRPLLSMQLEESISRLTPWTRSRSENIRRFAAEVLRPRGVWCAHIAELKETPHLGLPLLEPLLADPAKYVQDSVSNWLSDAAKTQPDWVEATLQRWEHESPVAATERIVGRVRKRMQR
ncbi:MAG: DNA alkylation repair protein [Planctomycetaceae bacterium]|nr:DNA alkylation repair protein [Planctomycetaceae bacterium]